MVLSYFDLLPTSHPHPVFILYLTWSSKKLSSTLSTLQLGEMCRKLYLLPLTAQAAMLSPPWRPRKKWRGSFKTVVLITYANWATFRLAWWCRFLRPYKGSPCTCLALVTLLLLTEHSVPGSKQPAQRPQMGRRLRGLDRWPVPHCTQPGWEFLTWVPIIEALRVLWMYLQNTQISLYVHICIYLGGFRAFLSFSKKPEMQNPLV